MSENILIKTKDMIDITGDRYKVNSTVMAIESAYKENESGLIIGHCKAMIEGVCKSVLDEYGVEYASDIKVGKLAKSAVNVFQVGSGVENEKKAREAFKRLVNSFANNIESAITGIGELRNDFCPLAHGKSNSHIPLDMHYAEFIILQTDSIIGFIHELRRAFQALAPDNTFSRDPEFDAFLDEEFDSVTIYEETFLPSEILYNVSPESYQRVFEERQANLEEIE